MSIGFITRVKARATFRSLISSNADRGWSSDDGGKSSLHEVIPLRQYVKSRGSK